MTNTPKNSVLALGDLAGKQKTRTVTLTHPDDPGKPLELNGKPITIQIVGSESDDFQAANYENRKINNTRALAGLEYDPSVEDTNLYRSLAYCTKGWDNIPSGWLDGTEEDKSLPFKRDTAQALYKRLGWLRAQVQKAVWAREPFGSAS